MDESGYGLWGLVVINSAVFIIFGVSFFHPRSRRDWRAMGGFSAFVVALFVEMYGYPLTIYLLSGWLGSRFPAIALNHDGGHLWSGFLGWEGDPHLSPFHIVSYLLIAGGMWLIWEAWRVLWQAQQAGRLATTGPYGRVRHPQYAGFLLVMLGFLLQWPTLPTLVMFPILVAFYRRLAIGEERTVAVDNPEEWPAYAVETPRFIPRRRRSRPATGSGTSGTAGLRRRKDFR